MASFHQLTQNRDLKLGTYIGEFATPGIGQILKGTGCQFAFVDKHTEYDILIDPPGGFRLHPIAHFSR